MSHGNFDAKALHAAEGMTLRKPHTKVDELPQYIPELRSFIAGKTTDASKIDDVAQEVIARTCKSANINQLNNPLAYMITVAKTVLFDQWKSNHDTASEIDPDALANESETMEHRHIAIEKIKVVADALDKMPPLRRQVFEMRRLQGMSREEIAKTLDISLESVKKHINRAIVDLTLHMENQGWGE